MVKVRIRTDILRIKGTRYYDADIAFSDGQLAEGSKVALAPDPENQYDVNAVRILSRQGHMLGHVSKDVAKKYQNLSFQETIHSAVIQSACRTDDYAKYDIRVAVTYTQPVNRPDFEFPSSPGVYEISMGANSSYIGATKNLHRRFLQHINMLLNAAHPNLALQSDFEYYGAKSLTFEVICKTSSMLDAEKIEEEQIRKRISVGLPLYNRTVDGKGIKGASKYSSNNSFPLSFESSKDSTSKPGDHPGGKSSRVGFRDPGISSYYENHTTKPLARNGRDSSELADESEEIINKESDTCSHEGFLENGDYYEGAMLNNQPHGEGTIYFDKGEKEDLLSEVIDYRDRYQGRFEK